jgi:hypothetical protein
MSRKKALEALDALADALDEDDYYGVEWAIDEIREYLEKVEK